MPWRTHAILVVEDSPDEASILERGLSTSAPEHRVVKAGTTIEAEEYLFRDAALAGGSQADPDLVFLDLRVPPAGGLSLLDKLRHDERTKHIPVIVLSGSMRGQDVQELYRHGANSFIDKPLDAEDLKSLVGNAAKYWLKLNLLPQSFAK